MFERNLRMFVSQRINLFSCCEESIKLQLNFKRTAVTKIILNAIFHNLALDALQDAFSEYFHNLALELLNWTLKGSC